jgi:hypothetical protein
VPRAGSLDTAHLAIYTSGLCLSCHHLVRHSTSFLSPSCLHLRATPFSAKGVGACAPFPYSSDTSPRHRLAQWLLHVHEDVSHHARTIVFAVVRRPVCLPGLRPILPPQPAAPAHGSSCEPTVARRRGYGASRSCSWPFSMRAVEEDMVAPATLRLSWRLGVQV